MPKRPPQQDPKAKALQLHGSLNPHPEKVADEGFAASEFFDGRDLVQVKYEMVRRVRVEGLGVSQSARAFGFSRPAFYQAQSALERGGLPALLPQKRGPRGAHKLSKVVVDYLLTQLASEPIPDSASLVSKVLKKFGLSVHPRSVERALERAKKKSSSP